MTATLTRPARRRARSGSGELRLVDWFCGAGGSTQGCAVIPGVQPVVAANHDPIAIESHATNFPDVEHIRGDIKDVDVAKHPYGELKWSSPECTQWSVARGKRADYADNPMLWDDEGPGEDVERSRALMEDVIRYLRGMHQRGEPVLAGVVENVVDIRKWVHWLRWLLEIEALGYRTRLIAFNSAHAAPVRTPRAPQSRDRLYLAYWHKSLGRDPDWDKWLRPACWCTSCDEVVDGIQTFKRAGQDMGRYGQQYYYRCPKVSCRGSRVEPYYRPAASAIDWTIPGTRIGDRDKPLSPKTMARIEAALRKWGPAIVEAGGNQYDSHDPRHPQYGQPGAYSRSWPLDDVLRTLHTTSTKGLLTPPMLVMLRGQNAAKHTGEPLDTIAASGNHHGLLVTNNWSNAARTTDDTMATLTTATTQGLLVPAGGTWHDEGHPTSDPMRTITTRESHGLLVPYYGRGSVGATTAHPLGTLTTHDKYALIMRNNTGGAEMATPVSEVLRTLTTAGHQSLLQPPSLDVLDCLFRMLEPHEIGAGMAFLPDYKVLGTKRQRVKQYGNAVTPPVAEVIMSALVECVQGHPIDWSLAA